MFLIFYHNTNAIFYIFHGLYLSLSICIYQSTVNDRRCSVGLVQLLWGLRLDVSMDGQKTILGWSVTSQAANPGHLLWILMVNGEQHIVSYLETVFKPLNYVQSYKIRLGIPCDIFKQKCTLYCLNKFCTEICMCNKWEFVSTARHTIVICIWLSTLFILLAYILMLL